jgi:excisionase family DNA binding protein
MISTEGMLTVAEAAKRLHRSTEQIRRNLREGKLRGQRIGNQWFVEETDLKRVPNHSARRPLIPLELQERARRNREAIFRRSGVVFDVVSDLRADRESH